MLKNKLLTFCIVYAVFYLVILTFPALTIVPTDRILELIYDTSYVDSWTKGTIVYFSLVIVLPIIYFIILLSLFVAKKKKRKESEKLGQ